MWSGCSSELAVEVEDVAVGVALAEDRDEAEDVAGEAEAGGVGLDQALAGQLAGAVEGGLDREGRVLRRGVDVGLAVDAAGRGEGDPLDAGRAHRLQHVVGGDGVLLEVAARVVGAEADVGVGGEVEDEVVAAVGLRASASFRSSSRSPRRGGSGGSWSPRARNCSCPVEKLSYAVTAWPSASSRSTRLLPMNPAPPVTK